MGFIDIERKYLAERAEGKLARAIGVAPPGESREELDRMAREDERRTREGLVELRDGDEVWYKHLDELTLRERGYRLEAERAWNEWVRGRVERLKSEQDYSLYENISSLT